MILSCLNLMDRVSAGCTSLKIYHRIVEGAGTMSEKVRVVFEYDEQSTKWECFVTGADNIQDARDAFNAVAITVQRLPASLLGRCIVRFSNEFKDEQLSNDRHYIEPFVA